MDLPRPAKRPARETVVPMINVVFLLLIFFLMTAQITPPEPFEVTPPESRADTPADGQRILYISATGDMALDGLRDEAVFGGLSGLGENEALMIRADRAVSAAQIAALLPRLAAHGVRRVKLVSSLR
ncbi:biopolymer transport protein ExbD [Lutimaribacter pacificus]|uniref:Outer membrane transport energization protein ExbD n=1 Tax=Lutimaribacter pacificus TaxID=391948 RepID=A0A1H0HNX5_9RHOB|nr:biopolymer transporter ExbD [Lutimaribacter pacificus]SDO20869.1 biopolymer transport protein ExbD [Lutimaribacter pacificus]SHK33288.1 outer membrane transport energization protein ExbD [Lutimaribacter pacificus]